ncbi:MAG: efflux RND transporter periplasmic adaptor subunit [Pirellulales bacterium]
MTKTTASKSPGLSAALVRYWGTALRIAVVIGLVAGVSLLLVVLAGVFKPKVSGDASQPARTVAAGAVVVAVREIERSRFETAVGTIKPVYETTIASQLLARVIDVTVTAGQNVAQGDVLVRLDDADLKARLEQAEANVRLTLAKRDQAVTAYERGKTLRQGNVIAQAEFDTLTAAMRTATADHDRSEQAVREANVLLEFATIRAPLSGRVIEKRIEAGDTVSPGQPLLTLYDPNRMQMIASVRESLATNLKIGQKLPASLESLGYECEATVSEIVPEAQTASRTFNVKVTGPCPPGVYSGMFGRLHIPLDDEKIVVVPSKAIRRVGQLTLVDVVEGDAAVRRSVQLGRTLDGDMEVLSGLRPGEKVLLAAKAR